MPSSLLVTLVFLLGAGFAVADTDNHGVTFVYPTDSLTFNYNDTVNVSYVSDFSAPQLFTFCIPEGSNAVITELVQTTIPPYNGSSLVALEWNNTTTCWFDLRPNATAGNGANSPSFTILPTTHSPPLTFSLAHPSGIPSNPPPHLPSRTVIIVAIILTSLLFTLSAVCLIYFFWRKRQAKQRGYIRTNILQAKYIDQVDQKWHPGGGGAAGEYVYVKPMQSYRGFRDETKVKKERKPTELPVEERPVELSGYPRTPARSEGERYESRRHEGLEMGGPVVTPKRHNRFSWEPTSWRFG